MAYFAKPSVFDSLRSPVIAVCLLLVTSSTRTFSDEPIKVQLGKESAWVGEPVPLIITLYSVGPFSGTAAFELPEISVTTIIRGGSPTVGSETIDGESYLTQRHELSVFTRRTGEITIPPIPVRFSAKKSFTTDPEPVATQTTELTFESKRPDVPADLGIVVAASTLKTTEDWTPGSITELTTGDVVKRVVTREASGTTAMMMPAIDASAPTGVRIHNFDPVVRDTSNRGTVTAKREDIIKYQFEQSGTYTIPSIKVSWWDTTSEKLQQATLSERVFSVTGEMVQEETPNDETASTTLRWIFGSAGLLVVAIASLFCVRWLKPRLVDEERTAAAKVRAACRSNDPALAYQSWLQWKRGIGENLEDVLSQSDSFYKQLSLLRQHLYGDSQNAVVWSGEEFSESFRILRRRTLRTYSAKSKPADLPELNPIRS